MTFCLSVGILSWNVPTAERFLTFDVAAPHFVKDAHHETGKPARELPIRLEKLLG
jgi:hypothetical protein